MGLTHTLNCSYKNHKHKCRSPSSDQPQMHIITISVQDNNFKIIHLTNTIWLSCMVTVKCNKLVGNRIETFLNSINLNLYE